MNFSQQNKQTLQKFLNGVNKSRELEIRFGNFVYDHNTKNKRFESHVPLDYFYRCKNFLNGIYVEYNGKYQNVNTVEYSYPNDIRRTVNGNIETFMKKTSIQRPYNVFDYDIRLSVEIGRASCRERVYSSV